MGSISPTLAFVVYDMQTGILAQIADAERVLGNVLRLLAAARKHGVRTVFMRHYFMPTELAGVYQLRQAKIWQGKERAAETRPLIPHGSPGFALAEELEPRPGEAVLDKITMSAFAGTPLDIVLRDCGVRAYLVAGRRALESLEFAGDAIITETDEICSALAEAR
jgi:nicotinamidase-related amidase